MKIMPLIGRSTAVLAVNFAAGRFKQANVRIYQTRRFHQTQHAHTGGLAGVKRLLEARLRRALTAQIVNFVGRDLLYEIGD